MAATMDFTTKDTKNSDGWITVAVATKLRREE